MRVGILGAGGMGNVHASKYKLIEGVELAFFESDSEKADQFSKRWGAKAMTSEDDLIAGSDVVDVCLPTDLHLEFGLRAIRARKPVFMEKPLARTLDEGRELVGAARDAGVPLMPGQVVRFFPEFARAHDLVSRGELGDPAVARVRRGGVAPKGSREWFMDHARSGGVLLDLAVHDFDWLRWTLGEVESVYSRSVGAQKGKGPDYALTLLKFESGAIGHVESTWMDPAGFRVTFEVCGSDGMIEHDSRNSPSLRTAITAAVGGSASDPRSGAPIRTGPEAPLSPHDDPYFVQLSSFLEAVKEGREVPVAPEEGWAALAIAYAALESARTGEVVQPERFV